MPGRVPLCLSPSASFPAQILLLNCTFCFLQHSCQLPAEGTESVPPPSGVLCHPPSPCQPGTQLGITFCSGLYLHPHTQALPKSCRNLVCSTATTVCCPKALRAAVASCLGSSVWLSMGHLLAPHVNLVTSPYISRSISSP